MLSLRELYTVAISYKNTPEQFYKIIDISVKIYPASPVANLNAAAAAIERGNTQAAGRYLQMASHETLADRKSTRLNSSHYQQSRMPSSA